MARTYLVFGDIEGKLDVLRVECQRPSTDSGRCRKPAEVLVKEGHGQLFALRQGS
jgi:hypothetical protein